MKRIIGESASEFTSRAIVSGGLVFISGQIGSDPVSGKLISSDIAGETKQVMENLESILTAAEVDFSNVIKTSIYLTNIDDLEIVNNIYASYFKGDYPAYEVIEATALQLNAHIEISLLAASK